VAPMMIQIKNKRTIHIPLDFLQSTPLFGEKEACVEADALNGRLILSAHGGKLALLKQFLVWDQQTWLNEYKLEILDGAVQETAVLEPGGALELPEAAFRALELRRGMVLFLQYDSSNGCVILQKTDLATGALTFQSRQLGEKAAKLVLETSPYGQRFQDGAGLLREEYAGAVAQAFLTGCENEMDLFEAFLGTVRDRMLEGDFAGTQRDMDMVRMILKNAFQNGIDFGIILAMLRQEAPAPEHAS
ncbi:MAG: hypothetical protein LIO46_00705, partial [Clostridiales bacterium]|nr:hypothetical protein [Clostridiales bacterium]